MVLGVGTLQSLGSVTAAERGTADGHRIAINIGLTACKAGVGNPHDGVHRLVGRCHIR